MIGDHGCAKEVIGWIICDHVRRRVYGRGACVSLDSTWRRRLRRDRDGEVSVIVDGVVNVGSEVFICILCCAVTRVICDRLIIHPIHRDGDGRHVGLLGAVARLVGEAVGAKKVIVWLVIIRAVSVEGERTVAHVADERDVVDREALGVGVIGERAANCVAIKHAILIH